MLTRTGRYNPITNLEHDLNNLRENVFNSGVLEIAINLHGILDTISHKFSKDAVIDIIPEITSLLNKYDASVKVNEDLKRILTDLSSEKLALEKLLLQEKKNRKNDFDESITNEEKADFEISELKSKLSFNMTSVDELKTEISSKDAIINLLSNDAQNAAEKILKLETELKSMRRNSIDSSNNNDDFITPRTTVGARNNATCAIKLNNRFTVLSENISTSTCSNRSTSDKLLVKAQIHRSTTPENKSFSKRRVGNNSSNKKKRRVTIMADSQGKQLSGYLQHLDDDFDVFVYTKPGAKLKHVVQDGLVFVSDFTEDDFIIILAGSNDHHLDEPYQLTLFQGISSLLELNLKTNIIVCSVPLRYDDQRLNENILHSNSYLSCMVRNCNGKMKLHYFDINIFLQRTHFTRHGLHFNRQGKRLISKQLITFVKQNFINNVNSVSMSVVNEVSTRQHTIQSLEIPESLDIQYIGSFPVTPIPPSSPASCDPTLEDTIFTEIDFPIQSLHQSMNKTDFLDSSAIPFLNKTI
ncbi:uncharacterized protein LOC111056525 isoform X1 [Nilaparvata lugens]|uniref:uncharacterized protein LOC111056525 isoform X1 n=1 Tax=Nilaparvata lugens TaxID=108931 RepID=UPI00193C9AC1|nr:uncharacterized protein LOC111056525 isoform X1 [Nilaparvata lugens]XP_039279746.1 uncharacterized protein LOC111056525 isoform X1 [Nilaparvata lugens]